MVIDILVEHLQFLFPGNVLIPMAKLGRFTQFVEIQLQKDVKCLFQEVQGADVDHDMQPRLRIPE